MKGVTMKQLTMLLAITLFATSPAALAKDYKVEISGLSYKPAKLKIKPGDKVIWVNSDDRDHTVQSKDKEKSIDSGKIASGDSYSQTFEKAGKFDYGCEYHPRMKGAIEVAD